MSESSAYSGTGSEAQLRESMLNDTPYLFAALRLDGTAVFANQAVRQLMGREPSEVVGTNLVDILHPDDLERAIVQLTASSGDDVPTGITRFRLRHANGSWQPIEVFAAPVSDGAEDLIGIYGRNGLHQVVVEEILSLLLKGLPRREVLAPVCDVIQWHGVGSHLAICWEDGDGLHQVSTGIADALGGADGRSGSPWSSCRSGSNPVGTEGDAAGLPADLAVIADEAGVSMYWIEPVVWSEQHAPALVTVWTVGGVRKPVLHSYGMGVARNMVELILRWTEQIDDLSTAARFDPLTGLANRRTFFAALKAYEGSGAVLYCDLDRFKPVNDTYGHAAGDRLLRLVAHRIEGCVREDDLVARLGGDEFAVLCSGAASDAGAVATRIRQAIEEPFLIDGHPIEISVSIGVAFGADGLDENVLGLADQALFQAKAGGRSTIRQGGT